MTTATSNLQPEPDTTDDAAKIQMERVIKATLQQMTPQNNTANTTAIIMAALALLGTFFTMADGWSRFRVVESGVSDIKASIVIIQGDIKSLMGAKK